MLQLDPEMWVTLLRSTHYLWKWVQVGLNLRQYFVLGPCPGHEIPSSFLPPMSICRFHSFSVPKTFSDHSNTNLSLNISCMYSTAQSLWLLMRNSFIFWRTLRAEQAFIRILYFSLTSPLSLVITHLPPNGHSLMPILEILRHALC